MTSIEKNIHIYMLLIIMWICGLILLCVGIMQGWSRHIIFGSLVIIGSSILGYLEYIQKPGYYDSVNKRYYDKVPFFVANPWAGLCPIKNCGCHGRIIFAETFDLRFSALFTKLDTGILCPTHGAVWFDLVTKAGEL